MTLIEVFPKAHQGKLTDFALLLLRLTFGTLMIYGHGWKKLLKFFGNDPINFADPFGLGMVTSLLLAVFAEVFCSFLLIIGFTIRLATIPLIITMLVAVFHIHWDDPFNKKELPLLYLVTYLSIFMIGAGRYSVDAFITKKP